MSCKNRDTSGCKSEFDGLIELGAMGTSEFVLFYARLAGNDRGQLGSAVHAARGRASHPCSYSRLQTGGQQGLLVLECIGIRHFWFLLTERLARECSDA